jgi:hypothetical protein
MVGLLHWIGSAGRTQLRGTSIELDAFSVKRTSQTFAKPPLPIDTAAMVGYHPAALEGQLSSNPISPAAAISIGEHIGVIGEHTWVTASTDSAERLL